MKLMRFALIVCAALWAAAGSPSATARAQAPALLAEAVDSKVTVTDGTAIATFAVKLTNQSEAAATNISVVFPDASSVEVDDLAPQQSRTTPQQQQGFSYPEGSSRSFPFPVTLKYILAGEATEASALLYLHVQ